MFTMPVGRGFSKTTPGSSRSGAVVLGLGSN